MEDYTLLKMVMESIGEVNGRLYTVKNGHGNYW
jgi:hypothetical protein